SHLRRDKNCVGLHRVIAAGLRAISTPSACTVPSGASLHLERPNGRNTSVTWLGHDDGRGATAFLTSNPAREFRVTQIWCCGGRRSPPRLFSWPSHLMGGIMPNDRRRRAAHAKRFWGAGLLVLAVSLMVCPASVRADNDDRDNRDEGRTYAIGLWGDMPYSD